MDNPTEQYPVNMPNSEKDEPVSRLPAYNHESDPDLLERLDFLACLFGPSHTKKGNYDR